jgi:fatty acid desaturase
MSIHLTPRPAWLKQIIWQDLVAYRPYEVLWELSLPMPWLGLAYWSAIQTWYLITIMAAFYFFLTGLRVTHNAFHYAVGLPRFATDCVMLVLSVLMLGAHHAIQVTHIRHHRFCLQPADVEGAIAKQTFWQALLGGVAFTIHIHRAGWRYANIYQRRWIVLELIANVLWLGFIWLSDQPTLQFFSLLILLAYALSAFFAVWTVHHDCPEQSWNPSRSLRSAWKSALCYGMFFHSEHHLFPNVPTCHLPMLAKRLDAAGFRLEQAVF